jgi:hypothetical protein
MGRSIRIADHESVHQPDRQLKARQVALEVRRVLGVLRREFDIADIQTTIWVFWGSAKRIICKEVVNIGVDTLVVGVRDKQRSRNSYNTFLTFSLDATLFFRYEPIPP